MNNTKLIKRIMLTCIILIIIIISFILVLGNKEEKDNNTKVNENIQELQIPETPTLKDSYEYNEFKYANVSREMLLIMYLNEYKSNCIKDAEKAYELLNEEYKEKKFGSIDNYLVYINNKKDEILGAEIQECEVNKYEDYEEYIMTDQYNNKYIFHETAVMEYTMLLDEYTIDTENFIEEYDGASSNRKAALNLKKFLDAIKDEDYNYAYIKLTDELKNTNFQNKETLENYIKGNWIGFEESKTINTEQDDNGNVICKINILNNSGEYVEKSFLISLQEEMDYRISFEI